ncbi:hypothetical protein CEXT_648891 [Caerostris extrusa]|uniref:Uncharacterized protein n=1 Tax=Caerostris extrusa TaxID=172846 RepID=A0AAV4WF24_CAEEX|nr:hypothetical protein CEXT_648891 [Caerostris extrusa]
MVSLGHPAFQSGFSKQWWGESDDIFHASVTSSDYLAFHGRCIRLYFCFNEIALKVISDSFKKEFWVLEKIKEHLLCSADDFLDVAN